MKKNLALFCFIAVLLVGCGKKRTTDPVTLVEPLPSWTNGDLKKAIIAYVEKVTDIVYQPQLELLAYLRSKGFEIFICTGGTVEFVRSISQQLYGVPKEQVIGTTFKYKFSDSSLNILREPALAQVNDKEGKPVSIQVHIGQRPVFACGNEGGAGDIAMLRYSQGNKYPSFQLLVNHDDSTREFYYQENDNASLNAAAQNNWHVVSMKNDWKKVFADN